MVKSDEFIARLIVIIIMSIFLIYVLFSSILNCALSHDIKNILSERLTLSEYASLKPVDLFCSSKFSFTRNGEEWFAFGATDYIRDIDVYLCKAGQCG